MNISIFGTGYVGLVTGTGLAELGNKVTCVDNDTEKVEQLLNGNIPIYEPGLEELVHKNYSLRRLNFTSYPEGAIRNNDLIFIAVGTPSNPDETVNLDYVKDVANSIGEHINTYKVIINKSTVPPGTGEVVRKIISSKSNEDFDVVSNPEFLKEGTALEDFFKPDRIVIGADSRRAKRIMHELYEGVERTNQRMMFTSVINSELIKYASNAMLATRISFMNELSRYCDVIGADVKAVAKGMGMDSRIGPAFLQAGIGYGGSCFSKDVLGLIKSAHENGTDLSILRQVDYVNEEQKARIVPNLEEYLGNLSGKTFSVWGLAFKPKTDDIRDASSRVVMTNLLEKGAKIRAYDPEAMDNIKEKFGDLIYYASSPYDALEDSDGILLLTEWNEFRNFDKEKAKNLLRTPFIFDGRNIYEPQELMNAGFDYLGVGRGSLIQELSNSL